MIAFAGFRLDVTEERLWKGGKLLTLRRKPFAILRYLAANPKRLVTQEELLTQVWGGAVVSESAIRSHLHELRQVLGDGVIETVIGRGYRLTVEVSAEAVPPAAPVRAAATRPDRHVVGRDAELAALRTALERASTGHRQLVVVSGEPGIGKTTLVDTFLDELEDRGVLAVRGHCMEQFGTPEAYLSVIEVLGRLRRSERGDAILGAFVRYAPTFLARMSHLVPDDLAAEVARRAAGGTESRMVRELAEALEVTCAQDTIVVVLEDLQWSDVATIDLLALLGQRTERAKLLLIATSRRAAVQAPEHPLSRVVKTLVARAGAVHLALDRIDVASVRALVDRRFPGHAFPPRLLDVVERITGGTPLFLVSFLDDLVQRGMLAEVEGRWTLTVSVEDVAAHRPDSIKQLIDIQLDRMTNEEQRVLEAASLVGAVFSTGPVAAALGVPVEQVDDLCDALARRGQFLRREASEELPIEGLHSRYAVTHALIQEVCEERGSAAKRQRWHRTIAEYLARIYAGRIVDVAHVVASHLDKAHLPQRAVEYYLIAADHTAARFAALDAVATYQHALGLLPKIPRTPERDTLELTILGMIGQLLIRTPYSKGADPAHVYERTIALAREVGDLPHLYAGLANLCLRHVTHAKYVLAGQLGEELAALALTADLDPELVEYGVNSRALAAMFRGEMRPALAGMEKLSVPTARAPSSGPGLIHTSSLHGPADRAGIARSCLAFLRGVIGDPAGALALARAAADDALATGDPIRLGIAQNFLARVVLLRRDPFEQLEQIAVSIVQRATAGFWLLGESRLLVHWAASHRSPTPAADAIAFADTYRARLATETLGATFTAVPLAELLDRSGHTALATEILDAAIAYGLATHEHLVLPDLYRLRGDRLAGSDRTAAIAAYTEGHRIAAANEMWLFALRNAVRLARLGGDRALVTAALAACADPQATTPDFVDARAVLA